MSRADRVLAKQTIATLFGENASGTAYRAKDAAEKGEPIVYLWDKGDPPAPAGWRLSHNMIQAFAGMTPATHGCSARWRCRPASSAA